LPRRTGPGSRGISPSTSTARASTRRRRRLPRARAAGTAHRPPSLLSPLAPSLDDFLKTGASARAPFLLLYIPHLP
jgi:hypothetical protein